LVEDKSKKGKGGSVGQKCQKKWDKPGVEIKFGMFVVSRISKKKKGKKGQRSEINSFSGKAEKSSERSLSAGKEILSVTRIQEKTGETRDRKRWPYHKVSRLLAHGEAGPNAGRKQVFSPHRTSIFCKRKRLQKGNTGGRMNLQWKRAYVKNEDYRPGRTERGSSSRKNMLRPRDNRWSKSN